MFFFLCPCPFVKLNNIFIRESMIYTYTLWVKLYRTTPNTSMWKLIKEILVDLHEAAFYCQTLAGVEQDQRIWEVWRLPSSFRVDTNKTKLFPYFVKQNIDAQIHLDRNRTILWVFCHLFYFFYWYGINLVVHINAAHIFSVAFNAVDQIINIIVTIELDVCIVDPVFSKYAANHLFINLGQRCMRTKKDTTSLLNFNNNVWLFFIQTDSSCFDFKG